MPIRRFPLVLALSLPLAGCLSPRSPDRGLKAELGEAARGPGGAGREAYADALASREPASASGPAVRLTPSSALQLAYRHSRDLQTQRELLQGSALALLAAQRRVGITSSLGGGLRKIVDGEPSGSSSTTGTRNTSVTLSLGDTLATGATVSLSGSELLDFDPVSGNGSEYRTTAGARIEQPLLRGAGYEASHETLIQSERTLVYSLRAFELARQELALEILGGLYDLVQLSTEVVNTEKTLGQAEFLRRRSEAMFQVQLAPYLDVLRSEQQELSARARLDEARTGYTNGVRQFVIDLGLPPGLAAALDTPLPTLRPLRADEAVCLRAARERRLDLFTARGKVEDAERALRVARQARLPELNATASTGLRTDRSEDFPGENSETTTEIGVEFSLPLDNREARDGIRAAEIALAQARRGLEELHDTIEVGISRRFARLLASERRVEIERRNVDIAGRRVENAVFRFKNGELSNRDVVEAEDELLAARNALAASLIGHEMERLGLLRDLGLLEVDATGALRELSPGPDTPPLFDAPVELKELKPHDA